MVVKGVLFSIISVVISTFIVLLFWSSTASPITHTTSAVEARVEVLDHYLDTWDSYVEDATDITAREVLISLTSDIPAQGVGSYAFYTEEQIENNISSCLLYGAYSFNSVSSVPCFSSGVNSSLLRKLDAFVNLTRDEVGIDMNYTLASAVTISDWAPFEIMLNFTLNYTVTDDVFATWNRSQRYAVVVNVEQLPDPLFAYYGDAYMEVDAAERFLYQYPKPRDLLALGDVEMLIANYSYVENVGMGPTYLQRLRGITSDSVEAFDPDTRAGFETYVIPENTSTASGTWQNRSFAAHQVFSQTDDLLCGNQTLKISGLSYTTFRLDPARLARLNFNGTALDHTCP